MFLPHPSNIIVKLHENGSMPEPGYSDSASGYFEQLVVLKFSEVFYVSED